MKDSAREKRIAKGNEMTSLLTILSLIAVACVIIDGMIWVADKLTNGEV